MFSDSDLEDAEIERAVSSVTKKGATLRKKKVGDQHYKFRFFVFFWSKYRSCVAFITNKFFINDYFSISSYQYLKLSTVP